MSELLQHIYSRLYDRIPEIAELDKFAFKLQGKGYRSTTGLRLSGEEGKSPGAVVIYEDRPGVIKDFSGDSMSIWDYIQQQYNLSQSETYKKLAELAGVELPKRHLSPAQLERIKQQQRIGKLREDLNTFLIECLSSKSNTYANTEQAQRVRDYLTKDRGYKTAELELQHTVNKSDSYIGHKMQLGFTPKQSIIEQHLESIGYTKEEITELGLPSGVGTTHLLSIPFYQSGRIIGFSFRSIDPNTKSKYLYTKGTWRGSSLFNLRASYKTQDIILVEGLLDALVATVRGVENVVALGGTGFNKEQLKTALRAKVRNFTLCLDNDKAGQNATQSILKLIREEAPDARVYVAELPEGVKDPDELIKEEGGIEKFKEVLSTSLPSYEYLLNNLLSKYADIEEAEGGLTAIQQDELLTDVVRQNAALVDPIDRVRHRKTFLSKVKEELSITEAAFEDAAEDLSYKKEEARKHRELNKALKAAEEQIGRGEDQEAIKELYETLTKLKQGRRGELVLPYTSADWVQDMKEASLPLKTGISELDKYFRIPRAAITLIGGRTSHGKTTFMFNLMLEMSKIHEGKFYFFEYEEQKKSMLIKLLNRLVNKDLRDHFQEYPDVHTNEHYLQLYIKENRGDIEYIEAGKKLLFELIDTGRIVIVDKNLTVEQLSGLLTYLSPREKIAAVFIDYIQRIGTERQISLKRDEISYISDTLLKTAKETGLPLIIGAQFNRDAAKGGKPKLEHLKEAGNLEEDANLALSVYNLAMASRENEDQSSTMGEVVDIDIDTLKNRDGEANRTARLKFDRYTRYMYEDKTKIRM